MTNILFPLPVVPQGAVAWPVKKSPSFKTVVQTPASNRGENRIALAPYPIWLFELDFEFLKGDMQATASALQNMVGFFGYMQGAANDWLFEDPFDNAVTTAQFAIGDGATTVFQLTRSVGLLVDIVQNVSTVPELFANGVPIATSAYTISTTGVVTFTTAPTAGAALTWTGNFWFRCRFLEDELEDLDEFLYQFWELKSLKFKSVIL
jgi:uncharacterized protein (TIGR02217 family)